MFSEAGIDPAFLVPTKTGLEKSILDATMGLRALLKQAGIHDYGAQPQGGDHKVQLPAVLLSRDEVVQATASLYRPETKQGDPRIWFSKLNRHASPTDLVAVFTDGKQLFVINCSTTDLAGLVASKTHPFWASYAPSQAALSNRAEELLLLLKGVCSRGYVTTMRAGDTGVGFTLESLLGIKANSNKAPDYKGIELKAGRSRSLKGGRTTIFSQVPDWSASRLKGSKELLDARGRFHPIKQRRQLFHQVQARKLNSYGLTLEVDDQHTKLDQVHVEAGVTTKDVTWLMEKLIERLRAKHAETFWVKANTRGMGSAEEFHYTTARYTSDLSAAKFPVLLEAGVISLDYTITELGNGRAKDQGYLFRIKQGDLPMLFRSPHQFDLLAA